MRIIEHDGNYYHTSEKMKAMGLKCCHSCGYLMPIEKENCKCGERVYVIDGKPVADDLISFCSNPHTKICSMCKMEKPVSAFLDTKAKVRGKCDECRFKYAPYSKKIKKGVLVV